MALPFKYCLELIKFIDRFIQYNWSIERSITCIIIIINLHTTQLISYQSLIPILNSIKNNSRSKLLSIKNRIGYNIAGISYIYNLIINLISININLMIYK